MARILRRRVVQMPKVASGRRNLASEINQYLQLGLTAGQIIEKIIPDDPKTTPEAYGEALKARLLGTGQENEYDKFTKRQLDQFEKRQSKQPSPLGAKAPLSPALTPAPSAEGVAPRRGKYLPEQLQGTALPVGERITRPSNALASDIATIALTSGFGADDPEFIEKRDELIRLQMSDLKETREQATASADEQIDAEMQRIDAIAAATPVPPAPVPEPAPEVAPKPEPTQADKAVVSGSVSDARKAREETFEKVMANFNKGLAIVEENSNWWNRGEKIDKYIAAFERNLAKSPLMNSGSAKARGAAVDVLTALINERKAEGTSRRIIDEGAKNRAARTGDIILQDKLRRAHRVASERGAKSLAKFRSDKSKELRRLSHTLSKQLADHQQKYREQNDAARNIYKLWNSKPEKTPEETAFWKEFPRFGKIESEISSANVKLKSFLANKDLVKVFAVDEADLLDDEIKLKKEVLKLAAIVQNGQREHEQLRQRAGGRAGQTSLIRAIPAPLPELSLGWLDAFIPDETGAVGDGDSEDGADLDKLMRDQGVGVPE